MVQGRFARIAMAEDFLLISAFAEWQLHLIPRLIPRRVR